MNCPACQVPLAKSFVDKGINWICPQCHGRCATISFLRQRVPREVVNGLWWASHDAPSSVMRSCPSCRRRMREVAPGETGRPDTLDACLRCQFVWFDSQEYQRMPVLPEPAPEPAEPPEVAEAAAMLKIQHIRENARPDMLDQHGPDSAGDWLAGILGYPVEEDSRTTLGSARATLSLIALATLVSVIAFINGVDVWADTFGFIPAEAGRLFGLTLFSSFFLHIDIFSSSRKHVFSRGLRG